jgi:alkanesulfonate monooxygenase SsuD/methylene tetrahydromethanopterin reductase-like flavin-dependent oxidoreductase (luciferase family)
MDTEGTRKFSLGLFATNTWGGLTKTLAAERWEATWDNNVAAAKMAEDAGLDFVLPFGVWTGLQGDAPTDGYALEVLTWAAGILEATERITVFGTVHTPFIHPVMAAKQCVTCDHIGHGRFGLNIVSGFNVADFELFGIEMLEHDERYAYTEEWLTIVKRLWAESEPFDFDGKYFQLRGASGNPRPVGHPKIISAGSSPVGRRFAAEHADFLFMYILQTEGLRDEVADVRRIAAGRDLSLFGSCVVICRPTSAEADEYYNHIVHENGDWATADYWAEIIGGSESVPPDALQMLRERVISGQSILCLKGDPDEVAQQFKQLSDEGLDGMAFGLVNFIDDLPIIRDEVIPRMEEIGLRVPGTGLVDSAG